MKIYDKVNILFFFPDDYMRPTEPLSPSNNTISDIRTVSDYVLQLVQLGLSPPECVSTIVTKTSRHYRHCVITIE